MRLSKLNRALNDRSGNIAVITAVGATVLIGAAAFAIDTGKMFVDRRYAQSVADLAALAGATSPTNAPLLAQATVDGNALHLSEILRVRTGTYVADPSVAIGQRFVPGPASSADAVEVTLATTTPTYFGRFLGRPDAMTIRTTATAANTSVAAFSIGSRLLELDGGVLNQLLGKALGGEVSLTVMDYRTLADLKIDAFDFFDALATKARISGPTYDSLMSTDVKVADVLHALVDVASQHPDAKPPTIAALTSIKRAATATARIKLQGAVDLGPYAKLALYEPPNNGLSLSALNLLTTTARLADGQHQVAAGIDLTVPALASVTARLTVGERPVSSGWTAVGRPGAMASTAQTRLHVNAAITALGLGVIELPIYIDVAKAEARLAGLRCATSSSGKQASLDVTPAIAEAWIGSIPQSQWNSMSPISGPPAAPLVKVGLLSITGQAHVKVGNLQPTRVDFSSADIDGATIKTVSTRNIVDSLTGSLIADLNIGVGGIGIVLPGQKKLLKEALSTVAAPLDATINSILAYLGVGLGQADVWIDGMRCDKAVLVN